jgi:hypothetical protein
MKILIDINDSKAAFLMELLGSFSFVNKTTQLTEGKAELLKNLKESVEEVKLAKQGKVKLQSAKDLLDEL